MPSNQFTNPPTDPDTLGAHVEIVEEVPEGQADSLPCIKPRTVYVNGVNVGLIAAGGVTIEPGLFGAGPDNQGLQVTLRLLPRTVSFYARERGGIDA